MKDQIQEQQLKYIPCHYENYLPLTYVEVKQKQQASSNSLHNSQIII